MEAAGVTIDARELETIGDGGRRRPPRGCKGASTILPAKSSTSARRSNSARYSSGSWRFPGAKKRRPVGRPASRCCRAWRASIRSVRWCWSGAKSPSSRTPTSTSFPRSSIRVTDGCVRNSIRPRPRPGGFRRRIRTCRTFRFAASSGGEFAGLSSRAATSTCLLAADYSQIELRLMAHLSGDRALRTAFEEARTSTISPRAKSSASPRTLASIRISAAWPRA